MADEQAPAKTVVLLGNSAPLQTKGGKKFPHPFIKQSVTKVIPSPKYNDEKLVELTASTDNDRIFSMIHRNLQTQDNMKQFAIGIHEIEQLWGSHSGRAKPDWVSCNDVWMAKAVGFHFGIDVMPHEPTMMLTQAGRDIIHEAAFSTGTQPAATNYIAITPDSTDPVDTDTTLNEEIQTAGGGLVRAQATYAHTAGTDTTTLTNTFTANGNDSLPVVVAKIGAFNDPAAGVMTFETLLNSTATLTTAGDNVTITEAITAG